MRSQKSITSSRHVSGDAVSVMSDDSYYEAPAGENSNITMNPSWYGLPVEEVDTLIFDNTFCSVSKKFKRHYIYRYSASKSLFLFGPINPIRKAAIYLTTHCFFDLFITLIILLNCITLAMDTKEFGSDDEIVHPSYTFATDMIEIGFTCVYVAEMLLKIIAQGLLFNKFAYLRSKWNILDFCVVSFGVFIILWEYFIHPDHVERLKFLMTLRVLRAVKALVIFPGIKLMLKALVSSVIHLVDVLVLVSTCLLLFSGLALQVFQGRLQQKCVIDKGGVMDPNAIINVPLANIQNEDVRNELWTEWVSDWENWKTRDYPQREPTQCGNQSTARLCGEGYTCIGQLGHNPEHGWIHFDNIGTAMLATFQVMTTDFWERVYDLVVSTNGIWSVPFFVTVIFMGFYYLLNLLLAVVIMSYENEVILKEKTPTSVSERLRLRRHQATFSFDHLSKLNVCKLTYNIHWTKSEKGIFKQRINKAERAHQRHDQPFEYGKDNGAGDAIPRFDEFVMKLVGIREALASEEMEEEDNRRISGASANGLLLDSTINAGRFVHNDVYVSASKATNDDIPDIHRSKLRNSLFDSQYKNEFKRRHRHRLCGRKCLVMLERCLTPVVQHKAFEWTITVCILLNTLVLALEHHRQPHELEQFINYSNIFFLAVFSAEVILKALALQNRYFMCRWNQFDLAVVLISYAEFILTLLTTRDSYFRTIRCLRLLRVFKLARSWVTLKILLHIIFATLADLIYLTVVLLIVLYIFAILGMALVGGEYRRGAFDAIDNPMKYPSWRWEHFGYSFMMVFRVLCGEWIEPLLECLQAQEYANTKENHDAVFSALMYGKCFLVYFLILIVGNFILFNLFLALLLNSFDLEELNSRKEKEKEQKAKNEKMKNIIGLIMRQQEIENEFEGMEEDETGERTPSPQTMSASTVTVPSGSIPKRRFRWAVHRVIVQRRVIAANRAIARAEIKRTNLARKFFLKNPVGSNSDTFTHNTTPESTISDDAGGKTDCCPIRPWMLKCYRCCRRRSAGIIRRKQRRPNAWTHFRHFCFLIVTNRFFDWFMFLMIVGSSILLCFEDNTLPSNPNRRKTICILNYIFTGIFVTEMILKWFALGLYRYWTHFWTVLDGGLVVLSLISLGIDVYSWKCSIGNKVGGLDYLTAVRALRALRPLRAVSRMEGMKIIVSSLVHAIPAIFNVMLVCLVFWLIFAVVAVQLFKGKFYRCVDKFGGLVDHRLVANKTTCCAKQVSHEYSWTNSISNYDHVGMAYLSLFQVATFEGWMELMSASVNSVDEDKQPKVDNNIFYYLFYVIFIIFGSFFTLKLFITVIIDNFNMLKKRYQGNILEILLTPSQRNYYIAMKSMGMLKPKKMVRQPKSEFRSHFYFIAFSKRVEAFIITAIILNVVIQMLDDHNRSLKYVHMISGVKAAFATLYALEVFTKVMGLGGHYFTVPMNVFDCIISVCSVIEAFSSFPCDVILPIPPATLRIIRILHVGRLMHGFKWLSGIRKLLFALTSSLPALVNVGALLILVTFIYAILGMALFMGTPRKWSIDSVFNFETFGGSCLMLLRIMTVAGWNEVLDSLFNVKPECGPYRHLKCGYDGEPKCPQPWIVITYLVSYLLLTNQITMNLFCAVILEKFIEACDEQDLGIVESDLEMFYLRWSRYDHYATQFIDFDDLSDFLDCLAPPFRMPKPNTTAIVMFNLPIARGRKIHCLDILHALIKHILGNVDDSTEFSHLQRKMETKFRKLFPNRDLLDIVSDTRQWKIELNAVILIQRCWRRKRARLHPELYELEKFEAPELFPIPKGRHRGGLGSMLRRMRKD